MKQAGLFLLLLISITVTGQPRISYLEKYTVTDGLSNNHITALLQDRRGFIWIGTEWGLNRYDGRNFKQYTRTGLNQLIHYEINSLAEDREGNIWIGSNKGVSRFNPLTENITSWTRSQHVFADKKQNIWLIDQDSILLFNGKEVLKKFVFDVKPRQPNANSFIAAMMEDRHGALWLATSYGVRKLDINTGIITTYTAAITSSIDPNACTTIYEDHDGDIWAGTWGEGVLKVNKEKRLLENYRFETTQSNLITAIHSTELDNHGYLLFSSAGTNGGLLLADKNNGLIQARHKVTNLAPDNEAFSLDFSTIIRDRQQNTWIASSNGLYKIDVSKQAFHWTYLPGNDRRDDILFHSIPSPIAGDSSIFISSMQGWWRYDPQLHSIQPHNLPATNRELAAFINNYTADENGIWFTSQKGFGYYDLKKNSITDHSAILGKNKIIKRSWGLARDRLGQLWLSTYREGLVIFDPLTKTTRELFNDSSANGLRGTSINGLKSDKSGFIWLVSKGRLYRVDPLTLVYKIFPITDADGSPHLHISANNRVFVWTEQHIFECTNDGIKTVFNKNIIIRRLAEDNNGSFWLQTHDNFYRLSPDFDQLTAFASGTRLDGNTEVSDVSFHGATCMVLSKGKLLSFSTGNLQKQQVTAPVLVSSVVADTKEYFFPNANKAIQLDFKDRLRIEISALNFSNEGGNRLFYKLDGWDDQWRELLKGSVVSYEQLPTGNYNFLAKASNGDTELIAEPIQLHFKINPPFWKTGWFIALVVAFITAIGYWFYRYRLRQAIKMERMRTRIATDLHDDIGATLSSISMYSEAVKKQVKEKLPQLEPVLEKMGENSRNMVSSMNDIVWAVNPGNDQGGKLLERMESYARDNCSVNDTRLRFNCNDELRSMIFALEYRKNIYLIFKEALNNALKYAGATTINITADKKGSHIVLTIDDNGKGFDTTTIPAGNGLKNIRSRAKEIGAEINISSEEGKGTTLVLDCKI
jgi:signal transduction histidine kinase/ligand-binding sensor domain-containing protein